ncbi:MAG: hypothetical protein KAG14_00370 [Mycoplasmataceae bacterium]|nr:hypothetical protein [Mycoplasmataceae bacterium]
MRHLENMGFIKKRIQMTTNIKMIKKYSALWNGNQNRNPKNKREIKNIANETIYSLNISFRNDKESIQRSAYCNYPVKSLNNRPIEFIGHSKSMKKSCLPLQSC